MVFRIEGNPNMTLDLRLDPAPDDATNPGVAATAMAAVNAIPAVIDAPPGLLSTCHWPVPRSSPAKLVADMTDPKAVDLYYDPFDFAIDDDPYPVVAAAARGGAAVLQRAARLLRAEPMG